MIEAVNLTKRFDNITAVDHINAVIKDGNVFGLIGTNGAGKSTFLRLVSGILKPEEGHVTIDHHEVFENPAVKARFFYISDEQYFFSNSTPKEMMEFYRKVYPKFDKERFHKLMANFGLDENRKIQTFSKGMKKQVSVICGVCAGTDYLLCDETFDGLDPVMRQAVKSIFAADMEDRGLTVKGFVTQQVVRPRADSADHRHLLLHAFGERLDLTFFIQSEICHQLVKPFFIKFRVYLPVKLYHLPGRGIAEKILFIGNIKKSRFC